MTRRSRDGCGVMAVELPPHQSASLTASPQGEAFRSYNTFTNYDASICKLSEIIPAALLFLQCMTFHLWSYLLRIDSFTRRHHCLYQSKHSVFSCDNALSFYTKVHHRHFSLLFYIDCRNKRFYNKIGKVLIKHRLCLFYEFEVCGELIMMRTSWIWFWLHYLYSDFFWRWLI